MNFLDLFVFDLLERTATIVREKVIKADWRFWWSRVCCPFKIAHAAKKRVTVVFKVLIAQGKIWGTTTFPDFSFLSRKKNVSRDVFYLSTWTHLFPSPLSTSPSPPNLLPLSPFSSPYFPLPPSLLCPTPISPSPFPPLPCLIPRTLCLWN